MPSVLNVGGGSKDIPIPQEFAGWEHLLLDIDEQVKPDLCCNALEMKARLAPSQFDAVYCSHNLEHYYAHQVPEVLAGFLHVLKPGGYVLIRVPDIAGLIREIAAGNKELDDVMYQSPSGPIMAMDMIWGYGKEIARSGNPFFAHKTGFGPNQLGKALVAAGFINVSITVRGDARELVARGHKGA